MITLENAIIKAEIHPSGAELHCLYHKENNLNYLWNGDASFWPRHSPVLFPIVGGLIDDSYFYKGKKFNLAKHGFARDMVFEKENSFGDSASFILRSSAETLARFPFDFALRIKYQLNGNSITVTYEVENHSDEVMPFSIGTHPAFNIPLVKGTSYTDYYLDFSETENSERWILEGNVLNGRVPYLQNEAKLHLKKSLFYEDAVIFKDLKSTRISICSDKTSHGLHFDFKGFPYMGIWAAKDAPFVCIEPWCGIPDKKEHNQDIESKEGIIKLPQGEKWIKSWSITVF